MAYRDRLGLWSDFKLELYVLALVASEVTRCNLSLHGYCENKVYIKVCMEGIACRRRKHDFEVEDNI